ncbi:hypothetical protein [Cereibacter sphaeroides]|uniref:hypothetical protein n=1 Tax=Cereibacter sphaeroides TaxID=1063 RepID=UPI000F54B295|nr:hypothetical protein [Cereibacter sphaeroides]AZB61830.1 hypothetical protein EBL88_20120 [Cereibacter sphaeroides]
MAGPFGCADAALPLATFRAPEAIRRGLADRTETRAAFYARLTARTVPKPRSPSRAFAARAAAAQAVARS